MGKVFIEVSLSLDGIIAGPGVSRDQPMGREGRRLYHWLFEPSGPADSAAGAAMFETTGAVLIGRRTLDAALDSWGEDGAFGLPCFVVTHRGHDPVERTRTRFEFVTGGIGVALERARAAAGERDVCIMGGAELARQYLAAGLVDELRVHLAPVVLGAGQRFFEGFEQLVRLEPLPAVETPHATHLRWKVLRGGA